MMGRKHLDSGGILDYDPEFLSKEEADSLYDYLYSEANWEQKFFTNRKTGEKFPLTRLTSFYTDNDPRISFAYSGINHEPQPWLPRLLEVKGKIERETGATFNTVLMNLYPSGNDFLNAHADIYSIEPIVANISLGATRTLNMRQSGRNPEWKPEPGIEVFSHKLQYDLAHGSLFVMSGTTQDYWTHEIPKMENVGPRISLTFRKFIV